VVVVVALVSRALRLLRRVGGAGEPWRRVAAVGVLGALLAMLTHGMVDSAYFQPDLALAFWWSVVALIAPGRAPSTLASARS
jgi:hypothetical protein